MFLLKGVQGMRRTSILKGLPVVLIVYVSPLFAQQQVDSTVTIEQILVLQETEIDIGLADLVLAKDFYPDLNIESFLNAFDYMANRFTYFFGHYTDPDQRVRALNTFLYQKGKWNDNLTFSYDDDDLRVAKLSNKFINGYLATKKGSCITSPMMYVIMAERLGFPIYASRLPYHFFVRYIPETKIPKFQENIEATNGGSYVADTEYRKTFLVPEKPVRKGVYLRTLTKKEYIASLLLINANEWIARKNLDKAKYYLELSIKYDLTFSSAYMNYATIHFQEAMQLGRKMNEEKQSVVESYDICIKNSTRNQASPVLQLPSPMQQIFKIPEPDFSAFQVRMIKDDQTTMVRQKRLAFFSQPTPPSRFPSNPELQISLSEITQWYTPLIQAKLEVYEKYKQKAEEMGIVRDYPMTFFQIQSKSLKQFQEKGAQ